jgi:hypothetical protein
LISKSADEYEIIEVPIVDAKRNSEIDSSFVSLDEKGLKGHGIRVYTGYPKTDLFNDLEPIKADKKIKEFYNDRLQKGNNKFIVTNIQEFDKFDYDNDFRVHYDFAISDYVVKRDDEIYINLNLNKVLINSKIDESRKTDIELDYKRNFSYYTELAIPDGYELDYLPENLNLSNDCLSVTISYEHQDRKIIYKQQVKFDLLVLKKSGQKDFMDLTKKVENAYKGTIVLKKNKN